MVKRVNKNIFFYKIILRIIWWLLFLMDSLDSETVFNKNSSKNYNKKKLLEPNSFLSIFEQFWSEIVRTILIT